MVVGRDAGHHVLYIIFSSVPFGLGVGDRDITHTPFYLGVADMASNTRGRLKEHLTGVHNNMEWGVRHCADCLELIQDKNPELTKTITILAALISEVDKVAQQIYATI